MKLKAKAGLVLASVIALSVVLNFAAMRQFVFPSFVSLERVEALRNMERVQVVTPQQLIPFAVADDDEAEDAEPEMDGAIYEFEPGEEEILEDLLPRNMAVQIFRALLENAASEQGARMMAMDNATRNAGDMIDKLTLTYNRSRQAAITKELIEIVSGAEAL